MGLRLGALLLDVPAVMGVLNVTPDSFSDGGRYTNPDAALRCAVQMAADGADLIDIGGESTRPGAARIGAAEEMDRVVPVIERVLAATNIPISIDTSKPEVMRAAVAAGASMINDVRSLHLPGALAAASDLKLPICLMHMQGEPDTMQLAPHYDDLMQELAAFFRQRIDACLAAGINKDCIVIDPGFGFGKTVGHNVTLLAKLGQLLALGYPVMVGVSRKSTLGTLTGRYASGRVSASVAAAVIAMSNGADIVRVHDVVETVDAVKIVRAVRHADSVCNS